MRISELIAKLNTAQEKHGDVEVVIIDSKESWNGEGRDYTCTKLGGIGTITDKLAGSCYSYDKYEFNLVCPDPKCKAANSGETLIALYRYGYCAQGLPICDEFEKPEVHFTPDGDIVYMSRIIDKHDPSKSYTRPWPICDEEEKD